MQFSSQKWGVPFLRVEGDTRFLESRERGGDGGGGGGEGERERDWRVRSEIVVTSH